MAFQAVHDYSQAVVELSSDVLRSSKLSFQMVVHRWYLEIHRLSIINDVKILLQERSTLLNNLLQYMIEYSILEKVCSVHITGMSYRKIGKSGGTVATSFKC